MTRRRKVLIGAGVGVLVAVIVAMNLRGRRAGAIEVEVDQVGRGRVVERVSAAGRVQPEVQVKISANVSGRIEALGVKEGDAVREGDFLVQLDRTRYQAAADRARAVVSSAGAEGRLAEARLERSERTLTRLEGLEEKGLSSEEDLDAARTQVKVERATHEAALDRVAQARATLEQAEDDLAKTTIVSPMDGVVSQLNSEVGEVVLGTSQFEGTTIMIVADLTRMEVEVEVDENDIVQVSLGDTADIEVDALPDTTFRGVVTEIANTAITRGRGTQEEITNFAVKVGFLDRVPQLRPGMSAGVDVTTAVSESTLFVPIQAVTLREPPQREEEDAEEAAEGEAGESAAAEESEAGDEEEAGERTSNGPPQMTEVVFVLSGGKVELRPVETGLNGETTLEVVSGLEEGEEIVVGSYRALSRELEDGSPVEISRPGEGDERRGEDRRP